MTTRMHHHKISQAEKDRIIAQGPASSIYGFERNALLPAAAITVGTGVGLGAVGFALHAL